MFETWKFKWDLWQIRRTGRKQYKKLVKRNATEIELGQLENDQYSASDETEREMDRIIGTKLDAILRSSGKRCDARVD
jgi:hypothetical protein